MYYPSVLSNVVFFSPNLQVLLNEVLHRTSSLQLYPACSDSPPVVLEGKWRQFQNKGIVTTDMLEDDRFSACYIPDIFISS